jgi:hypothetical protein
VPVSPVVAAGSPAGMHSSPSLPVADAPPVASSQRGARDEVTLKVKLLSSGQSAKPQQIKLPASQTVTNLMIHLNSHYATASPYYLRLGVGSREVLTLDRPLADLHLSNIVQVACSAAEADEFSRPAAAAPVAAAASPPLVGAAAGAVNVVAVVEPTSDKAPIAAMVAAALVATASPPSAGAAAVTAVVAEAEPSDKALVAGIVGLVAAEPAVSSGVETSAVAAAGAALEDVVAPAVVGSEAPAAANVALAAGNQAAVPIAGAAPVVVAGAGPQCPICLRELSGQCGACHAGFREGDCVASVGACGHTVHFHCVVRHLQEREDSTCPSCRAHWDFV